MNGLLEENKVSNIVLFYTCTECKESYTVKDNKIHSSKGVKMITDRIRCPYCSCPKYWTKKLKISKR